MRQNNLSAWKYSSSLDCLLFFAERLDELLFHHTTDTYRYSALSIRGLAAEYCTVYKDVNNGVLSRKNLMYIIDEFNDRLNHDDIAQGILSKKYVAYFTKNYESWDIKTQHENMRYVRRKLSNQDYYKHVGNQLKSLLVENKHKRIINQMAAILVKEIMDHGYNENYIYKMLHKVFFNNEVVSIASYDTFISKFDFVPHKYDVYIGYSNDMSSLSSIFGKLEISGARVSMIDIASVPFGIKTKRQKTFLEFKSIESYDAYSAFEIANAISSCVVNSYSFFRHDRNLIRAYGQVIDENHTITPIEPQKLLKNRVPVLSRDDSTRNAESLIRVQFLNRDNIGDFSKITRIHNSAICSERTSDSLLSLWAILESIVEDDEDNSVERNSDKKERSKIGNVISYTIPFLKSTYIQKLVKTCMADIIRWDESFFSSYISNNGFGNNDLEHTFAFLAFESMQSARDELYSKTEMFPLLRFRVYSLSEQLHNSKYIKEIINSHAQRIKWHLYRIYRARNYIIHDANENEHMNQGLVINLHSYVDVILSQVIDLISSSPYDSSIHDALTRYKLSIIVMDDILKIQQNENITAENAMRYFYYDFER